MERKCVDFKRIPLRCIIILIQCGGDKYFLVILNLFQDNKLRLRVILKQVQDDEFLAESISLPQLPRHQRPQLFHHLRHTLCIGVDAVVEH
jgi:hypothetical protein